MEWQFWMVRFICCNDSLHPAEAAASPLLCRLSHLFLGPSGETCLLSAHQFVSARLLQNPRLELRYSYTVFANADWATNRGGRLYNYFTYGCALTEVQVDLLTGEHIVLQTDIVMDVGKSLNPAIDIGQVSKRVCFYRLKAPFCKDRAGVPWKNR